MEGRKRAQPAPPVRFGAEHHNWIGDDVSYKGAHARLHRRRGKAGPCVFGCTASKTYWASLTDDLTDPDDYAPMCARCHSRYDEARASMTEGYAGHHLSDPRTRLTEEQVRQIRAMRAAGHVYREIASAFGISRSYAHAVASGLERRWA